MEDERAVEDPARECERDMESAVDDPALECECECE